MLAQAVTGTPGHINTMARSVGHFLEVFPVAQMKDGDIYVTNDPWKGTGHLYDLVVVSPTFMDGRIVALFACTTHLVDMGGVGQTPEGRQIYHEGLFIPLLRLARAGEMNEDLLAMIRANVREPVQVIGDVYALIACNEIGSRRLVAMMREFALRDLDMLGEAIISRSRRGMAEAIGRLPQGTWSAAMRIDGYEAPIDLVGTLTIGRDTIHVDYTGTSGMSSYAINCPLCYTEAYTTFGVNCVVAPHIPNNTGTLDAVRVTAPEGTILSAVHPAAVYARSVMGHMLPDVVYGCLDQVLPGRVPAEGTSNLWTLNLIAGHGLTGIGTSGGYAVHGQQLPFGGRGRAAVAGRIVGDAVSLRCAQCTGGGDGGDHAAGDLAQGTASGFRRRRSSARRTWAGHGDRIPRGCGVWHFRPVRAGEIPGARPQRRRTGTGRSAVAGVRCGAQSEGFGRRAARRSAGGGDAGRRWHGAAEGARS